MSPVGEAWKCPHCGQRILRSAVTCPACQRRLRFDAAAQAQSATAASFPLHIEGTIHHPPAERAWEYSVIVQVRDAEGTVLARHVVGVGAIHPGDTRTFTLQVEMRAPEESAHATAPSRPSVVERAKPASTVPPKEQPTPAKS
jgi:hypothetical protein